MLVLGITLEAPKALVLLLSGNPTEGNPEDDKDPPGVPIREGTVEDPIEEAGRSVSDIDNWGTSVSMCW